MTNLEQRKRGEYTSNVSWHDALLAAGGIVIDEADYDAATDRIYDVKGMTELFIKLTNTGENPLKTMMDATQKEFLSIDDLVNADFTKTIETEDTLDSAEFATGSVELTGGPPVAATGTITCASVLAGDTVTVNGLLYTAVAGAKANNTQFSIDTGDNECAADLAASITADVRVGTLNDVTAAAVAAVVTCTQSVAGAGGNATTLVSSDAGRLAVSGAGTFTGGVSSSMNGITVDGVQIMSGAVQYITSLAATATAIAANINAHTSSPNYTAEAVGALITISATVTGPSTDEVVSTTTTLTKTDVNMSGGSSAESKEYTEDVSGPEITAVRLRFKEASGGNPSTVAGILSAE